MCVIPLIVRSPIVMIKGVRDVPQVELESESSQFAE